MNKIEYCTQLNIFNNVTYVVITSVLSILLFPLTGVWCTSVVSFTVVVSVLYFLKIEKKRLEPCARLVQWRKAKQLLHVFVCTILCFTFTV